MTKIVNQIETCKAYNSVLLSAQQATQEGYSILWYTRGCGEVFSPSGGHYTICDGQCDCPDATYRDGGTYDGRCKHVIWLSEREHLQHSQKEIIERAANAHQLLFSD